MDIENEFELSKVVNESGGKEHFFQGYSCPSVNVCENSHVIIVEIDLPGVKKEDIELDIEPTRIEIKGKQPSKPSGGISNPFVYTLKERMHSKFKRTIPLSTRILVKDAKAKFFNGLLTVIINKPVENEEDEKRRLQLH